MLNENFHLGTRLDVPAIGLGTWLIDDADAAAAVRNAVEIGYRAIDTAQAYGNEHGVGVGIKECGVDRDSLFISTKLAAEIKDYEGARDAIDGSLRTLGLDYIDLLLIHAPQPWADFRGGDYSEGNREAWRAMEEAYHAGKLRSIGVSNFTETDLKEITKGAEVAPHVNQLLVHAGNTPVSLLDYCRGHNIFVQAYSPIGHGAVLENPTITQMAQKYGVTVAQLCIRYVIQLGCQALPKTANPDHMRENADVDFVISDEDVQVLRDLDVRDYGEDSRFPVYSGK